MKKRKNEDNTPKFKGLVKTNFRFSRKFSSDERLEILFYTLDALENHKGFIEKFKNKFKNKLKDKFKKETLEPSLTEGVERFSTDIENGLTDEQVSSREEANLVNSTKVKSSKSFASIFFKNIFTFFNMLWLIIAVALIVVGSYTDLIFIFVIIANTAIAIVQEI